MNNTILIVEDEAEIVEILQMYLHGADYNTHVFSQGLGAVEWIKLNEPSLIILDIDLPGKSGLDICKEVRQFSDVPIIMTTAKVEEIDRLIGLEIGADDYVCKPYSVKELILRIKANLRRFGGIAPESNLLVVNKDNFSVGYRSVMVELTSVEVSLFFLLYSNSNRIYSRAQIMDLVYQDYRDVSDRTVDSHIRNLRKKLKTLPLENELIRSIYGAGYKFDKVN